MSEPGQAEPQLAQVEPARWESGAAVGRYTLLTPIARGGMAEIWLARQKGPSGFEKIVVVKRLVNTVEADPENVVMFQTEARLAAQLSHPNIVQVIELGEHGNSHYLVMEYLEGENLATVRRRGYELGRPIPTACALRLIAWAAEGLHYSHTRVGLDGKPLGIVHRDVSPQNLFVLFEGGLKIVDFGIAKVSSNPTISGKIRGKLGYMSPEQARCESVDARSDVFALGVCAFELLTQSRFIGNRTELECLAFLSGEHPIPRIRDRRPELPSSVDELVAKAMARDPALRFQTARELQVALEAVLHEEKTGISTAEIAEYMRGLFEDRIRKRRLFIEAAMNSELTPNTARHLSELAQGIRPFTQVSHTLPLHLREGSTPWPLLAVILLLASALGWLGRSLVVSRSTPEPAVTIEPLFAEGELTVSSDPAGVELFVDGARVGTTPVKLSRIAPGQHLLEGRLAGHEVAKRTVTLSPGRPLEVLLTMVPERPLQPEPPTSILTPLPPSAGTETQDAGSGQAVPGSTQRRSPDRGRGEAQGRLTLKTEPWTTVYLGKRRLGDTPLLGVSLPAGRHTLLLVNQEKGVRSSVEVVIRTGQTTVKKLKF